ncbi:MAG: 3-hydroxyacyl-CoA dehydrogenase, partial [Pseudomonadota bacterium]
EGGLRAFCDHFSETFNCWWDDLGNVHLTEDVAERMISGVEASANGDNPAELSRKRDELLLALQIAIRERRCAE